MKTPYKWLFSGIVVVATVGSWLFYHRSTQRLAESDFEFAVVDVGDICYEVSATGKIQPVNTVTVGTQVSGIVKEVLVDYNSEVKADEVLAKLDTALLHTAMQDAEARLGLATAKKQKAEYDFKRLKNLYQKKLVSADEYEKAEIDLSSACAEVRIAQANYQNATCNYHYATIKSPVSGTVIAREIEAGQTVAASFQAPVLFKIAEDLSKMQIETNVAEADIGVIKPGMQAIFTVDAHPQDEFYGVTKQIRLSPTEESNVVMYTVIIEIDNRSRKLLPGMTASVRIKVAEVNQVLRLPIQVFQYHPSSVVRELANLQQLKEEPKNNEAMVYCFKNQRLVPVVVTKGVSSDDYVEVKSGLKLGDQVIAEANDRLKNKRK